MGDISHDASVHLHLDIVRRRDTPFLYIGVLEIDARNIAARNYVGAEQKCSDGDKTSRNHIGAKKAAETHAGGLHRDDFRITRQFRGEENDGDEDKERTEQIGEVGDEVQVVVEDDLLRRHIALRKLVNLLVSTAVPFPTI